jgi:hypothetical protein
VPCGRRRVAGDEERIVSPPTAPADVLGIDIDRDLTLTVSLSTASGTAYARTGLTPAERAAIPHLNAMWGPVDQVACHADVVRGMLRRAISALGYGPPVVVVRPGDLAPAAAGRPDQRAGVGILDAVALLLGDRTGVAVEVHSSDAT